MVKAVRDPGLSSPRVMEAAESSSATVEDRTKSGVRNPSNRRDGFFHRLPGVRESPLSSIASRMFRISSLAVGKKRMVLPDLRENGIISFG